MENAEHDSLCLDVVDNDYSSGALISDIASEMGIVTSIYSSSKDFIKNYRPGKCIVCVELNMPEFDGMEVLRYMAYNQPPEGVILISGADKAILKSSAIAAEELGINTLGYLQKPFSGEDLRKLLAFGRENLHNIVYPEAPLLSPTREDLMSAIAKREISVVFQPQYDCKTGVMVGAEALARWDHPDYGIILPTEFRPMAESLDLIYELDTQVMETAIAEFSELPDAAHIKLSVNFSTQAAQNIDLPDLIIKAVQRHGLQPDNLCIELTETALLTNLAQSLDSLNRIRMKGVNLAIDNFGAGHWSLSLLSKVPFTQLKIDTTIVESIDVDFFSHSVVKAVISLAKDLGIQTVASGASRDALVKILTDMDCDLVQGYALGGPMPLAELKSLCADAA